jgi:hypothetical protein
LEEIRNQTESFGRGIRSTSLEDYANDPRYQYTMPPLGLRGLAAPVTRRREIKDPSGTPTGVTEEVQEYILSPEESRNRALERFNREAEMISRAILEGGGGLYGSEMLQPYSSNREAFIDVDRGDKYTTSLDVFNLLNDMSSDELWSFKTKLVQFGLLDENKKGEYRVKDINDDVWAAALTLGERANENGIKYQPFIEIAAQNGLTFSIPKTTAGATRTIPPVRLSSPEDLRFTANQVALRRLGRELTQPEQEAFITSYNQVERDFHNQYYSGAQATVEPPSPQAAVETRIGEEFTDEAQLYQMGNVLDSFRSILSGGMSA